MKKLTLTDGIYEMVISRAENDPTGTGTSFYGIVVNNIKEHSYSFRLVAFPSLMDEIYSTFCESL